MKYPRKNFPLLAVWAVLLFTIWYMVMSSETEWFATQFRGSDVMNSQDRTPPVPFIPKTSSQTHNKSAGLENLSTSRRGDSAADKNITLGNVETESNSSLHVPSVRNKGKLSDLTEKQIVSENGGQVTVQDGTTVSKSDVDLSRGSDVKTRQPQQNMMKYIIAASGKTHWKNQLSADQNGHSESGMHTPPFSLWMKEDHHPGSPFINNSTRPLRSDLVTSTVHYFWCKENRFEFINYLSVLSVVKVIQPLQIVFHYTHLPVKDNYHTWFQELKHHLPQFVLHDLGTQHRCNNLPVRLASILHTLEQHGGIYVGENTIIKNFTLNDWTGGYLTAWKGTLNANIEGVIIVNPHKPRSTVSRPVADREERLDRICCTRDVYELNSKNCSCLIYSRSIYPKDIFLSPNKSAELFRWLAYGTTQPLTPRQDFEDLTPRISHFVWFGNRTFDFSNLLSVLSTIYIAGMEKCYFHGDTIPTGKYWDYLVLKHSVNFIYMDFTNIIYNQKMIIPQHTADVAKAYILLKYGGMAQDGDVFWVSRVPDRLLTFDTVLSYDWPERETWPETFNLGIVLSKPRSKFLDEFLITYRSNYFPLIWDYNPIRMPYRAYERQPQSVFIYPHLQVMFWGRTSHPTWIPGYIQPMGSTTKGHPFNWRNETLSIHITWPKEIAEMKDYSTVQMCEGLYCDIGRLICEKASLTSSSFDS